MKAAEVFMVN